MEYERALGPRGVSTHRAACALTYVTYPRILDGERPAQVSALAGYKSKRLSP